MGVEEGNDQATVSSLLLVSSLCLAVSPCLSPPFPSNLFSGPRQSLRELLSSDQVLSTWSPLLFLGPQHLPAQRASGLASRLPSPSAVFTLPLPLALPSGWLCSQDQRWPKPGSPTAAAAGSPPCSWGNTSRPGALLAPFVCAALQGLGSASHPHLQWTPGTPSKGSGTGVCGHVHQDLLDCVLWTPGHMLWCWVLE